MKPHVKRAREIQDGIREVLIQDWDPCHVKDEPGLRDEYDAYIGGIYRLLAGGASVSHIAEHLASIERDSIGSGATADALLPVARLLKQLNVEGPA